MTNGGKIARVRPAVYHVAQNKHCNDRQRKGMMVTVGKLEVTRRARN